MNPARFAVIVERLDEEEDEGRRVNPDSVHRTLKRGRVAGRFSLDGYSRTTATWSLTNDS